MTTHIYPSLCQPLWFPGNALNCSLVGWIMTSTYRVTPLPDVLSLLFTSSRFQRRKNHTLVGGRIKGKIIDRRSKSHSFNMSRVNFIVAMTITPLGRGGTFRAFALAYHISHTHTSRSRTLWSTSEARVPCGMKWSRYRSM